MPCPAAVLLGLAATQANDPERAGCDKATVKHLKTVANINDSRTCLALSPSATTAVVTEAKSLTMAEFEESKHKTKHLQSENQRMLWIGKDL